MIKALDKVSQGEHKVQVASGMYGCDHSGLGWELLTIMDRKIYIQVHVKDCVKNEDGGDKQVLDVSSFLSLQGRCELGVCCNCGAVGLVTR